MSVEIIAQPHPLRSDAYRTTAPVGATLADLLGDAPPAVHAQVNGEIWPRERWHEPLPPGIVNVYAVPQGDAGRLLGMIVIAVAAAYTGGAAAAWASSATGLGLSSSAAAAFGAGVSAAITVAGSLALNALIPPKLPDTPSASSSTIAKSLTGTRNQMNPYGVVPRVYGNPRWHPPLAAAPVTEIAGNDQYLRMLLCLGYGPLEIGGHIVGDGYPMLTHAASLPTGTIRIGETDIGQYQDVEWQIGTPDQLTLFSQDIHEEAVSAALDYVLDRPTDAPAQWVIHSGLTAVRTTAADTREISLDLVFPQGLRTINSKGRTDEGSQAPKVDFRIEYRVPGGGWITVPGNSTPPTQRVLVRDEWGNTYWDERQIDPDERPGDYHRISGPSERTLRRNIRWRVAAGQYEVRVTRVRSFFQNFEAIVSDCTWTALRSIQTGRPYTGRHVLMALRIRATDQLNGVIDQLNIRTRSVVRVWDGSSFSLQPTDNPAWHYLDALSGPQLGRPIADSRINLEQLRDWAQWCDQQGLEYHWVHDAPETLLDRLRAIAAAGQAAFALQDGLYGVIRDDPDAPVMQVITPRNATGFSSQRQYRDLPHALRVKYIDPETWTDAERIVCRDGYYDPNSGDPIPAGAKPATVFEDLQTQGVASAEEAWHHGQYFFRQALLRPETYTVEMDWEHLALTRGDRARIAYDAILVGLGWGRVKQLTTDAQGRATVLVLDERVILEPSKTYGVRIRRQDGTQATAAVVADVVGETNTLTLAEPVAGVHVGDLVLYGEHGRESIDCKVVKIEPGPDFTARVTLVDAAPDIYDYGAPPDYDPGITRPLPIEQIAPPAPLIIELVSDSSTLVVTETGEFQPGVRVVWQLRGTTLPVDRVEARYGSDGAWQYASAAPGDTLSMAVPEVSRLAVQVRVRSIYGVWSAWSGASYFTPTTAAAPPSDVSGFALAAIGDQAQLSWAPVRDVDVLHGGHVRIYHAPSLDAPISAATPLARLAGTSTTATVPLLYGTYFALLEDAGGRLSRNPARIVSSSARIQRLNVVETVTEGPSFPGVHNGTVAIDGVLKLSSALTIDELPDIDSAGPIDTIGGVVADGEYLLAETADLGAVYTCRLAASIDTTAYLADDFIDGRGMVDDWPDVDGTAGVVGPAVQLYVRTTRDDPAAAPQWSGWQPFVVGDYTARGYQFRLVLSTDDSSQQIQVRRLAVSIDVPDRIESGDDVLIPPEGLTIKFAAGFYKRPAIGVTAENLANGERVIVSDKSRTGFRVQVVDAAGQGVARTVDWIAKGFGYEEQTDAA